MRGVKDLPGLTAKQLSEMPEQEWRELQEERHRTTLKERARIVGLQRSQFWGVVVIGIVLITSAFFFGRHLNIVTNRTAANTNKIGAAEAGISRRHQALVDYQVASCKRGNETRVSDNRAHLQNYTFDTELVYLLKVSLAQPQQTNTALTPEQRADDLKLVKQFVGGLEHTVAGLEWRHLIENCPAAVADPAKYKVPPAVKFSKRPPPYGALHVIDNPKTGEIE